MDKVTMTVTIEIMCHGGGLDDAGTLAVEAFDMTGSFEILRYSGISGMINKMQYEAFQRAEIVMDKRLSKERMERMAK